LPCDILNIVLSKVLVGGLLPLLGHGMGSASGEATGSEEDSTSDGDTDHGVDEDLGVLAWWRLSARTVSAKGNVVG
jgi:hypothetical protein